MYNDDIKKMKEVLELVITDSHISKSYNDFIVTAFKDYIVLSSTKYVNIEQITGVNYETFLNHYVMSRLLLSDYIDKVDLLIENMKNNDFRKTIENALNKKNNEFSRKNIFYDSSTIEKMLENCSSERLKEYMKMYFADGRMHEITYNIYSEYFKSLSNKTLDEINSIDVNKCFHEVVKTGVCSKYLGYDKRMDSYIDDIKNHVLASDGFNGVRKDASIVMMLMQKRSENNDTNKVNIKK